MGTLNIFGDDAGSMDAVQRYANRVFNCSVVGANEFKRLTDDGLTTDIWLSIVFEFLFFYVAVTANRASAEEGKQVTTELVDKLIPQVVDYVFEDVRQDQNAAMKKSYMNEVAARIDEYNRFDRVMPLAESDQPEGSALWSLCIRISALAGRPGDISFTLAAHSHMFDSLLILDSDPFLAAL
jgi:hypothetical protein